MENLETLYATVRRFVGRWTDPATLSVADDIVQETIIATARAPVSDPARLPGIARTIARRTRHRMLRAAARAPVCRDLEATVAPAAPAADPRMEALRSAMSTMPRHDLALLMDHYSGRAVSSIAHEQGLSPVAVRVRMHRARILLRRAVGRVMADG